MLVARTVGGASHACHNVALSVEQYRDDRWRTQ
jgi:hypothetical protein